MTESLLTNSTEATRPSDAGRVNAGANAAAHSQGVQSLNLQVQDLQAQDVPVQDARAQDAQVSALLSTIVLSLVDDVDHVEVGSVVGADGAAFHVRSAATDVGKLIGKSGRTARAIRTILSAVAAKTGRRYTLDIAL